MDDNPSFRLSEIENVIKWVGAHRKKTQRTNSESAPSRMMNTRECAAHIGRTPKAVSRLADKGQIPVIGAGRHRRFDREQVDRWQAQHARPGKMIR